MAGSSLSSSSASPPRLTVDSLDRLRQNGYVVVPNFLDDTTSLQQDLLHLRSASSTTPPFFAVAKIGHNGQIQDVNTPFRDIRVSETCSLWNVDHPAEHLPPSVARETLYQLLDDLRTDIGSSTTTTSTNDNNDEDDAKIKLDQSIQEVMYAWYPNGGYYRRHVDAETATTSMFRIYSFLLYLSDWQDKDGGCLRLHFDGGRDEKPAAELPCFVDVPPAPGTLVIFRSDLLPHEVLAYYGSQRMAVVGWFWGPAAAAAPPPPPSKISLDPTTIEPTALALLCHLRETVPNLRSSKLEETIHCPDEYQSGILHSAAYDTWGITMPSAPPVPPPPKKSELLHSEDDPRYWQKIAKFHPSTGQLVTLSLSGLRFRKLYLDISTELDLQALTTLDLSNTDMAADQMVIFLRKATNLKFVRLGGNGWPDHTCLRPVAAAMSATVEVVDCRYSNWTADHMEAFLFPDENGGQQHLVGLQKLYLEGNSLGDDLGPLVAWMAGSTRLRELYLGQNRIGPDGALQLSQIECRTVSKLYLEGNRIGAAGARILLSANFIHHLEKLYVENNDIPKDLALQLGQILHSPTMIGEGGLFQ
jgi:SM-20-related protein